MAKGKTKKPDKEELRKFVITISIALGVLGCLILWRKGGAGLIFISIGAVIFLVGLARPMALAHLYKAWMALALVLGLVMSHIILGVVYYLVVTPIGFFMRIVAKDQLRLGFDPKAHSYWVRREKKEWNRKSYEKMF